MMNQKGQRGCLIVGWGAIARETSFQTTLQRTVLGAAYSQRKVCMDMSSLHPAGQAVKHIAIYERVSSRQQTTRSQRPDLERWAAAQELPVVWYSDTATGKTMQRPGWDKLATAISSGHVATVAVWRIDRLGRTAKGLTALFDELAVRNVNLVSLKDGVDLSTPAGRLVANVLASIAQFETELRGERVIAGQAAARAAGKRWGGGKPGVPKKVTPTMARTIRQLYSEGEPIAVIARTVSLSRPTVYAVLRQPVPQQN